eukprot:TRINITY_DN7_c0_g1_i1.p1 TRINITY_DN7_c0_g1~~TRINITY_DN7_c0_g1_i1.p1  ORF type:complete len:240 (+),score=86.02 TRINITY_DN7_c0_g1_i1:83-802(+)
MSSINQINNQNSNFCFEIMQIEYYFNYDTTRFNFQNIIEKMLENNQLSKIHEIVPESSLPGYVTFASDQATFFHRKFYASPHFNEFIQLYQQFIKEVIAPQFVGEDEIIYQTRPTFRVHLPNNVAVGSKHKDSDYDHPLYEVNFWLPVTNVCANNGFYVESEPNKGDFRPINDMQPGQILRFWGNQCLHYNNLNDTQNTRVSFDFRVIPKSLFRPKERIAVKSGLKFDIGGYYESCKTN